MALAFIPLISIRVTGPTGFDDVYGVVDTGSDDTLLPSSLIKPLGLNKLKDKAVIHGVDGSIVAHFGTVDLEISDGATT